MTDTDHLNMFVFPVFEIQFNNNSIFFFWFYWRYCDSHVSIKIEEKIFHLNPTRIQHFNESSSFFFSKQIDDDHEIDFKLVQNFTET